MLKNNAPKSQSFLNLPVQTNWEHLDAQAVVFGAPFGKPYGKAKFPNEQSNAPWALRAASDRILVEDQAIDMDIDNFITLSQINVVDGGDIPIKNGDVNHHYQSIEDAVRFALRKGAMPISIGGDDGITNPILRGLNELGNVTVIQIDAHLDWREERFGERDGYSSPMRRASELPHVSEIHQVGIRSLGSARKTELRDALNWGAKIYTSRDIKRNGISSVVESLPENGKFFISFDVDGLDPSMLPGTTALAPGGLDWWDLDELLKGLNHKGKIIGLNVVELAPENDINQLSMIVVGRTILKVLFLAFGGQEPHQL